MLELIWPGDLRHHTLSGGNYSFDWELPGRLCLFLYSLKTKVREANWISIVTCYVQT
jgi:hypothetical protein